MNKAVRNKFMHKFAYVDLCFHFLKHIPGNGFAGSYGEPIFNLLRTFQIVFQRSYIVSYPHQHL